MIVAKQEVAQWTRVRHREQCYMIAWRKGRIDTATAAVITIRTAVKSRATYAQTLLRIPKISHVHVPLKQLHRVLL